MAVSKCDIRLLMAMIQWQWLTRDARQSHSSKQPAHPNIIPLNPPSTPSVSPNPESCNGKPEQLTYYRPTSDKRIIITTLVLVKNQRLIILVSYDCALQLKECLRNAFSFSEIANVWVFVFLKNVLEAITRAVYH